MKDAQKRLDAGATAMRRLAKQLQAGADEACADGDNDTSGKLWIMAGLQLVIYGMGRTILTKDGIRPKAGGKD